MQRTLVLEALRTEAGRKHWFEGGLDAIASDTPALADGHKRSATGVQHATLRRQWPRLCSLLMKLLADKPHDRPTAAQVVQACANMQGTRMKQQLIPSRLSFGRGLGATWKADGDSAVACR
jgi:hypothetical protein